MRGLALSFALLALAGCGSATTRTVTKLTTSSSAPPSTTSVSSTPTGPAISVSTATTTSAVTTTSAPPPPVLFAGAVGGGQQRPSVLELTGDGTLTVEQVQWTSWGGATATGSGTAFYHGCTPSCAAARTHTAVVSIRLSDVRSCHGRRYYAGVTLTRSSGTLLDEGYLQRTWSPC